MFEAGDLFLIPDRNVPEFRNETPVSPSTSHAKRRFRFGCHGFIAALSIFVAMLGVEPHAVELSVVHAQSETPIVGEVSLERVDSAIFSMFVDPDVSERARIVASEALLSSIDAIPRVTGLPSFETPITVFILTDTQRFRTALMELAGVRVDVVAQEVGGYTIERDGTMLIFFIDDELDDRSNATLATAHELAHLAVREASRRRAVPQWLNEGYAQWASYQVLAETDPRSADVLTAIDQSVVASALRQDSDLLPWSSLVTRTRFSRAGVDGWVNLAYGQSTLFVDFLQRRHGPDSFTTFLEQLGVGINATPAFSTAFGSFSVEEDDFEDSLIPLLDSIPRGLRRLGGPPTANRKALYAVVGGSPFESIAVSTDSMMGPQTIELDQAGFGIVVMPPIQPGQATPRLRVKSPTLGEISINANDLIGTASTETRVK